MRVEGTKFMPKISRCEYIGTVGPTIHTNDGYCLKIPEDLQHISLPLGDWNTEGPIEFGSDEKMNWERIRQPRIAVSGTMRLGKTTLVTLMESYYKGEGYSVTSYIEDISKNEHLATAYEEPTSENILKSQLRFLEMKNEQQVDANQNKRSLRLQDVACFNDWVYAYVNAVTGRLNPEDFYKYKDNYWVKGMDLKPAADLSIHLTTKKDQVVLDRTNGNARDIEVGLTPEYYLGLKAVSDEMFRRMNWLNRILIYVDEVDFSPGGGDQEEVMQLITEKIVELGWDEYERCLKN